MQERLLHQLHAHLREQHPDLLWALEEEKQVTHHLQERVAAIDGFINKLLSDRQPPSLIEALCMEELVQPLGPSKFLYLQEILATEFPDAHVALQSSPVFTSEMINMIRACQHVFKAFDFSASNEDDRMLRYAVVGEVEEYLGGRLESR